MIAEILGTGRREAKTSRQIANMLGTDVRKVTAMVQAERRKGVPICAAAEAPAGYYLAGCQEELQEFCGKLFHRGGEAMKTRRSLLNVVKTLPKRDQV